MQYRRRWLLLYGVILLSFLSLLIFLMNLHFCRRASINGDRCKLLSTCLPPPARSGNFSVLIGILTRADLYNRRHFLRLVFGAQSPPFPHADIDVKFVFCNLTKTEQRMLVALEILRYDDIIILNCTENMNGGKTYTYFSSLSRILPKSYDYVMKADDDTFIRLEALAVALKPLARTDAYYGHVIPCREQNARKGYMSGMAYALSWDLVEWIGTSKIAAGMQAGPEDRLVGNWLNMGGKGRNRFGGKPAMYDFPWTNGLCSHDLMPATIAVHRLKKWDRWLHVLRFFNVTKNLKPSPMYLNL